MLQYQSPDTDAASIARRRAIVFWAVVLVLGWLPFACGIVNGLVAAQQSYSPIIVASHFPASLGFMTLGAIASALSLIAFIRLRHLVGALGAAMVLAAQVSIAVCLGLS
jgi:hypothetical protein